MVEAGSSVTCNRVVHWINRLSHYLVEEESGDLGFRTSVLWKALDQDWDYSIDRVCDCSDSFCGCERGYDWNDDFRRRDGAIGGYSCSYLSGGESAEKEV